MQDVVTAFHEAVETHEQGVGGELPGVVGFLLVLEVGFLEFGAHVDLGGQLEAGLLGVLLDELENLLARVVLTGLVNDLVADLANQDHQAGRRVVMLVLVPNQQDEVHNGDVKLMGIHKVLARGISQLLE